jgi:membrane fusion protein, multidrug efflux system
MTPHGDQTSAHTAAPAPRRGRGGRTALVAAALVALALLAVGTVPRVLRHRAIVAEAGAATTAVPVVTVAEARLGAATGVLALPATVQGLHETGVYPRSNGYVRRWLADMGAQVRAGQTLAEIETPELDQELAQSRATLAQVEATRELARATLARWQDLVKEDAATRQELDEKQAAFNAAQASANASRANVERLTALRRFASVTAPFSGVITARNVDMGALVSAGGGGRPLFTIAQVDTVRVLTSVPQSAAPAVRVGQVADVTVQELGSAAFRGRVTRTAQALDPATRTLLTEIQVANPGRRLLPGMFAQATLTLDRETPPLLVPANTLMMRADGPQVAVVTGGRVRLTHVTLGRDYGTAVEVTSGLAPGATLVVNPGDEVSDGAVVRAAPAAKPKE